MQNLKLVFLRAFLQLFLLTAFFPLAIARPAYAERDDGQNAVSAASPPIEVRAIDSVPAELVEYSDQDWEDLRAQVESNPYTPWKWGLESTVIVLTSWGWGPIALATAAAVWLTSRGGAIYVEPRRGQDGKIFNMYKFRSMYKRREGVTYDSITRENDPRITPVGRLIRRFHIDELPQLYNVLRGEMSLIGPRPLKLDVDDRLSETIPAFRYRRAVKPGCSNPAQIELPYCDTPVLECARTLKEISYIRNFSLYGDLSIMFRTVLALITGHGTR